MFASQCSPLTGTRLRPVIRIRHCGSAHTGTRGKRLGLWQCVRIRCRKNADSLITRLIDKGNDGLIMRNNRSVRNICRVCGKIFYSAQPAEYCIRPSSCRVKAMKEKRKRDELAKMLTMDFATFNLHQKVQLANPHMIADLFNFLSAHGMQAYKDAFSLIYVAQNPEVYGTHNE